MKPVSLLLLIQCFILTIRAADVAREVKISEHCRAHDLFLESNATWVAQTSGAWMDPTTWVQKELPPDGARVLIPESILITVADSIGDRLSWIRVDGELSFATRKTTEIKLGSLFVAESGVLRIGSVTERVDASASAKIIFTRRQAREALRTTDPFDLSGGLISFGSVQIFGAERTGFGLSSAPVKKGDKIMRLDTPVSGWRVGDQLVIPGTIAGETQDELRSLKAVSADGRSITLDKAIQFDHPTADGVALPIGNLTRNVRFESEANGGDPINERAHIMLMHTHSGTRIEGAAFHRLGRTLADQVHTRPQIGTGGNIVPGSDTNPIGRYALHFHARTGASVKQRPQVVRGCVITDSPKHGLVNHGGHVLAEDNVTYQVRGSHFFGENGSEIGAFIGNLAVRSNGSGEDLKSRMYSADMGHTGHGFWLQGGGIEVVDNFAFGHADAAYIFHMKPHMEEGGQAVRFAAGNLRHPAIAAGAPRRRSGGSANPFLRQPRGSLWFRSHRPLPQEASHPRNRQRIRALGVLEQLDEAARCRPRLLQGHHFERGDHPR